MNVALNMYNICQWEQFWFHKFLTIIGLVKEVSNNVSSYNNLNNEFVWGIAWLTVLLGSIAWAM